MSKWNEIKATVLTLLGIKSLPVKEGKVELTEEQIQMLNGFAKDESFGTKFLAKANHEISAASEILTAKQKLNQLLSENGIEILSTEDETVGAQLEQTEQLITQQRETIARLSREEEIDSPEAVVKGKAAHMKIAHSKTHLFSSGASWDEMDRPWNQNYANKEKGLTPMATDWTGVNIDKINQDLGDYWRVHREEILELLGDYRSLPDFWQVINNIDDQITQIGILSGEITQSRKRAWLPKNKNKFLAQKGQVYDVQIDIEWEGIELQKIERSWMNRFNKEGSQPYKMSFVRMLMEHLLKKAREEDQIVLMTGVHFPDVERTEAGSFIHRGNGLLKIISDNMDKTYKTFDHIPAATPQNILDVERMYCDALPDEIKNAPGLVFYMSPTWIRWRFDKRKVIEAQNINYDPNQMFVDNYPNIRIVRLDFLDKYNFGFITTNDNISILQNIEREKSLIRFDFLKRFIYAFADYKTGIHVAVFGMKWTNDEPLDWKNQLFWSNKAELLTDVTTPVAPNATTIDLSLHNAVKVGINTGATAITGMSGAEPGKFYYIYGNGTVNATTIANNIASLDLNGSITLSENQVLVLVALTATTFREYDRYVMVDANENFIQLAPNATTADAALGNSFLTGINTGASAFTNIANAVAGQVYTIRGNGGTPNATTIAKSGAFARIADAITLTSGRELVVRFNGTSFVELSRIV